MLINVAAADDPRLAGYRDVRERDLARRDGLFVVEGKVTLQRLVDASHFAIDSVFIADGRLAPLAETLARLDAAIPVFVAPQAVMDGATGFAIHRGVLALARRTPSPPPMEFVRGVAAAPTTLLALIGLSNHDNVGACFRNAAAFGAAGVMLDTECCDPLYRKSIRVSAGTALSLPFAHGGAPGEIVDALDQFGFETWALSPTAGEPLPDLAPPPRLALMVGAEGPGLPPALMARARRVSIPMARGPGALSIDSLNVATAAAIALAHVFAARRL